MSRTVIGDVVADSQDKTIIVKVVTRKTHPLYRKQYSVSSKFHAHDANNTAKIGDRVEIEECRPMSRTKRWQLKTVVKEQA